MRKWPIAVLSLSLLAGCSEDTSTKPKEESKQEVKVDLPKETAPKYKTGVEAVADYATIMQPNLEGLSELLLNIGELSRIASDDPSIMLTAEYLDVVYSMRDAIYRANDTIRSVDPGDNPDIQKAHEYILMAMDELLLVAEKYPTAIENLDYTLLDEASQHITNVGTYARMCGDILDSLKGV